MSLNEMLERYKELFIAIVVSIFIGICVGGIDTIFGKGLLLVSNFREEHLLFVLPFFPVAGVIIMLLYTHFGKQSSQGMTLIFQTGFGKNTVIQKRLIPLVILTTWMTHLFGGSAGREGVSVQLGGTVANILSRPIRIKDGYRIFLIVGMAAGFGGLFQTPIAATFFALEVLVAGALQYEALLPALVAACFASYTSHLLGLEKFVVPLDPTLVISFSLILKLIVSGIIFGIVGGCFTHFLVATKKYLNKKIDNPVKRIFIVGWILAILFFLLHKGRYCGLGTNLVNESFEGRTIYWYDWLLKLILTVLTLGVGYQGGEVTPLFAIGTSLGVVLAKLLGLPIVFSAALGYVAVFASATNTFLSPILIGVEVFGTEYVLYFAIVCAIAHTFNGNKSIYTAQKRYHFE